MSGPILSQFAQDLYDALAPLAYGDEDNGYALAFYCKAIGAMFDQIQLYADENNGAVGWGWMFNPDVCPDEALPWLGQFVGVTIPPDLPPDNARAAIKAELGFSRGTPAALKAAIQATLTNSKHVTIAERDTSPYHMTITVYTPEVTSQAALINAIVSQKPAGIMYTLVQSPGETWNEATPGKTWDQAPSGDTWDNTTGGL